ncbi:hypothetical protein [Roseateles sp. L2-2]|uniref:hypothetical protein n=1 Tax=Roseateles sp. L2-2 TaxID=3422597 RepID=UPI003D35DB35
MSARKRRVFNDYYQIGQHYPIFLDPPEVVEFFLKALRHCLWPDAKGMKIPHPSPADIEALEVRVRRHGACAAILAARRQRALAREPQPKKKRELKGLLAVAQTCKPGADGRCLDVDELRQFVDIVNASGPEASIARAERGALAPSDRDQFSAARFLRNENRMRRLKPSYKAARVNGILRDIEDECEPDTAGKDYPLGTLLALCWHVKQSVIPDRSFHEKG